VQGDAGGQGGHEQIILEDRVKVFYDAAFFTPVIEEIRLQDRRLQSSWGERPYRILVRGKCAGKRKVDYADCAVAQITVKRP
jgi:hypothetical protein